jgi:YD repeat-containing protein
VAADRTRSVRRDAAGRLIAELDRHGAMVAELEWHGDGRLARAAVRIPDGSWVTVMPGAGTPGPWGPSDELRHGTRAITRFGALDWSHIGHIPPLAEPARLPAGAGTAVLNLIARLAVEQGASALRYDAPYPTEQLFLALLESFRWTPHDVGDPLVAFMSGALAWTPAPHVRAFESDGVYVQHRDRIEKISVDGRAFYRPDWQGVGRRTARVVRDAAGTVRASLQALGVVLEDRVVLAPDGTVLDVPQPLVDPPAVRPLPAAVVSGIVAIVVASSAPPLAATIRRVAGRLAFEWGPVAADLLAIAPPRVRLSPRLMRALQTILARADRRLERVGAAVAALGEAAELIGDELRRRAQAELEGASAAEQGAALDTQSVSLDGDAAAIGDAAEALLAEAQLA